MDEIDANDLVFDARETIEKRLAEYKIEAFDLVLALLHALGEAHLYRVTIHPNRPSGLVDAHSEIDALCTCIDPPRDPEHTPPASLLEALAWAIKFSCDRTYAASDAIDASNASNDDCMKQILLEQDGQRQEALLHILYDSLEQLNADFLTHVLPRLSSTIPVVHENPPPAFPPLRLAQETDG